jgi:hypothetical protein
VFTLAIVARNCESFVPPRAIGATIQMLFIHLQKDFLGADRFDD